MATHAFVLLVRPQLGREDEWVQWHRGHAREVLKVPGFVACKRFRIATSQPSGRESPWMFMIVYELETTDPINCIAELRRRAGTKTMPMSEASDPSKTVSLLWEPMQDTSTQPSARDT
jgi:hypothetical protein